MSRIAPALAAAFALTAFAAAIHADEPKAKRATPPSAAELQRRLLKHLQDESPKRKFADLSVENLTTEDIWDRLGVQVVKVEDKSSGGQAYVLRKDDVLKIGEAFGGNGVNSVCVADLNGDGKPLLLYSYNWGSGIHRSHIAALDCGEKLPKENCSPLTNYSVGDFKLKSIDVRTVDVLAGDVKVGRLALEKKDDQTVIQIRLEKEIPAEIKEKLELKP